MRTLSRNFTIREASPRTRIFRFLPSFPRRDTIVTRDPLERKLPDAVQSMREAMRYRYRIIEHRPSVVRSQSVPSRRFYRVAITEPPVALWITNRRVAIRVVLQF